MRSLSGTRRVKNNLPWEADYGGWGGRAYFTPDSERPTPVWTLYDHCDAPYARIVDRTPIVFVHGQGRTASDWTRHADYFRQHGYSGDELWAITLTHDISTHEEMATQLDDFIANVRSYTGRDTVHVVAHSLGVTGVRYWMEVQNRYKWVDTFVSIGGANHGIPLCRSLPRGLFSERQYRVFQFLTPNGTAPTPIQLSDLNDVETHPDVAYYTIRGKFDPLFLGNRESPCLDGAEENVLLQKNHDGIRESDEAVNLIHEWVAENTASLDATP